MPVSDCSDVSVVSLLFPSKSIRKGFENAGEMRGGRGEYLVLEQRQRGFLGSGDGAEAKAKQTPDKPQRRHGDPAALTVSLVRVVGVSGKSGGKLLSCRQISNATVTRLRSTHPRARTP